MPPQGKQTDKVFTSLVFSHRPMPDQIEPAHLKKNIFF
jgi:hypothetical protein